MRRAIVFFVLFCVSSICVCAEDEVAPGLIGEYFFLANLASDFPLVPGDKKPDLKRVDESIAFSYVTGEFYNTKLIERFYVRWSGTIRVPAAGSYTFFTESDDGSRLFIDGKQVVDNHGLHAMQEEEGEITLSAGAHRLKLA